MELVPKPQLSERSKHQQRIFAAEGVQFHPESILTEHGHKLLENFLEQ